VRGKPPSCPLPFHATFSSFLVRKWGWTYKFCEYSADTFNNAHSLTPTGQDFTVNYFDDAVRVQGYGTTGDLRLIPTFVLSGSPIGVVNAVQDPSGILKVAQAKGLLGLGLPESKSSSSSSSSSLCTVARM